MELAKENVTICVMRMCFVTTAMSLSGSIGDV